ncbi:hypothetical protein phiYS61_44 [Weissella phage phiYS61]|uniref:hypothetical protein n=1 Tax=Weissella phage phiYS61 TaxID=1161906 RepID=UPI000274E253|nr:hypothetical protein phiYS61_44 [Weissella phage phiYS61]AFF28002.1 hypothetical protein phiYS61_44 [Weissella phage phiYS61]
MNKRAYLSMFNWTDEQSEGFDEENIQDAPIEGDSIEFDLTPKQMRDLFLRLKESLEVGENVTLRVELGE